MYCRFSQIFLKLSILWRFKPFDLLAWLFSATYQATSDWLSLSVAITERQLIHPAHLFLNFFLEVPFSHPAIPSTPILPIPNTTIHSSWLKRSTTVRSVSILVRYSPIIEACALCVKINYADPLINRHYLLLRYVIRNWIQQWIDKPYIPDTDRW